MTLLLDSHVLLWYADGDPRLSQAAVATIQSAKELWFSAASVWELTLKMHAGRLPARDVEGIARKLGCVLAPITATHASAVLTLPRLHGDPFDHLLLAQAKCDALTLMTHDRILANYGVPVLLV